MQSPWCGDGLTATVPKHHSTFRARSLRVVEDVSSCNCPRFAVDRIEERFPCGIDDARLVDCALHRVEVVQRPLRAPIGERRIDDVRKLQIRAASLTSFASSLTRATTSMLPLKLGPSRKTCRHALP